jgi:hypothetical protein
MSSWKKVRNLFWQSPEGGAEPSSDEAAVAELQELLSNEHAVPDRPVEAVDPSNVAMRTDGASVVIDFQAQYDAAGIPNTDEVEQLERFLGGLDQNLPYASKLAAAKAFLGAVGKGVNDVLRDAEHKIERVRAVRAGQEHSTQSLLAEEQAALEDLKTQMEQRKARMEQLNGELEGVRHACLVEESRLQAARVFFGTVSGGQVPGGQGAQ